MKKLSIMFLVVLFILLLTGNTGENIEVVMIVDGEVLLCKSFAADPAYSLVLKEIYKGDFTQFSLTTGSPIIAFSKLSPSAFLEVQKTLQNSIRLAEDATINYDGTDFSFSKEKCGAFIDETQLFQSAYYENSRLIMTANKKSVAPKTTLDEVKTWTSKIASFSTDYSSSSEGRKHNIMLASRALDGYTLKRGACMSFNALVGERSKERGYKDANIIINGEFVNGIGGGVCQVSTTLYNVALRSGLTIKSSASHTLPVSYVDKGLDAMVSSATDLIICNNTDADVFFSVKANNSAITMTTYSKSSQYNSNISITSVTEKVIDAKVDTIYVDKLDENNAPFEKIVKQKRDGYVVSTYLIKNNVKTKIRTSHYKATDGIVEKTNPSYIPENNTI